jgi:hypothetical protein
MIKPYVITKELVKTYLGITDTTYDDQIDLYIPTITDDITRRNGICNQSFLFSGSADTDATVTLSNVSLPSCQWDLLYEGSCIYINGEDGVIESFDESAKTITLSDALTKTDTAQVLLIRNFPVGAKSVASQMVLYKINEGSVDGATFGETVKSRSIGPVSVSLGDSSSSSSSATSFGYPVSLTNQLSSIKRPRYI